MSVPPESIQPGRCFVATTERGQRVRRVTILTREGEVRYKSRAAATASTSGWVESGLPLSAFASQAEREVPCSWTPDADETSR